MQRILLILLLAFLAIGAHGQGRKSGFLDSFYKPEQNPILRADSTFTFMDPIKKTLVKWQKADVFNPGAIVKDNKIYLLYRCEDNPAAAIGGRTSRLGLAVSTDGIHFSKFPKPVLFPDNDNFKTYDYPGGCEDPRVVITEKGLYVVVYTSWNNKVPRLSIAFSKDLIHWQKQGPAFAKANDGKFLDMPTKSGSIITRMEKNKLVAVKIQGHYWMYWGEHFVNLAWSDNLADWNPILKQNGELKEIIETRFGKFDSDLTECGPPAVMTSQGIYLLYNGKNATDQRADPNLPKGTYSVGQVVFDPNDPQKVISRSESCFLKPTLQHERTGQYQAGTTFSEGLVYYKGKWFLYYGTADSFVGVAISKN